MNRAPPGHRQFISEATRGHSAKAVAGLTGSGAGGGNVNLAAPVPFLISERGQMVSHLWVAGGQVFDPYTRGLNQASGWTENGSVPRVGPSVPGGCDGRRLVEGVGPLSASNYFSLLGPDVLDFAGDFSIAVVFLGISTGSSWAVSDTNSVSGWLGPTEGAGTAMRTFSGGVGTTVNDGVAPIVGVVDVGCIGRAGTTLYAKGNLNALATAGPAPIAAALATPAQIGSGTAPAVVYEVWAAAITPSDALFTSIALEVKGRLGVTAW